MSDRNPNFRAILVVLCVAALLAPALLTAASDDIPRRPDGKPDLSGTYDTATLTPLVRPARYGDKLTITREEAAEIEAYWKGNINRDFEQSDPDRDAPPEGGTTFYIPEIEGAAGKVGGYNAGFVDLGDSTFEIDGEYRTSIITEPANGQMPPLVPAALERMKEQAALRHENTGTAWWIDRDSGPYDDMEMRPTGERCLLGFGSVAGPPSLPVMYNNLKRIIQTDTHVVIVAEMVHDARIVRLDSEHDPADMEHWLGDSIGYWDGDTLVIETRGFNGDPALSMASKDLRVVERYSRLDKDTLLYNFTVTDPATWTESWSGEYPWPASDNQVYEYACHEGNYALGGIMRGARILEQDALEAKASGSNSTGDGGGR